MSAGRETQQVAEWLYGVLTAGTTVTAQLSGTAAIYEDMAPADVAAPFLVYSLASEDYGGVTGGRAAVGVTATVQVIDRGNSYARAGTIMGSVDALLQGTAGSVSGLAVLGCHRNSEVRYSETDEGIRYIHYGGEYVITAESVAV